MDAQPRVATTGLPVFSPAQIALLDIIGDGQPDERTLAREMSVDVQELRTMVTKLARYLNLPEQTTHAGELSQLAREAATLNARRAAASQEARKNGNGFNHPALAPWQGKLAEVAAAIAAGVRISVDPYKIRPMHGQPRDYFPEEEQESLEGSLGLMGQVQDLIIRKKPAPRKGNGAAHLYESDERVWRIADTDYEICDGERRWRGAMAKKLLEVRANLIEIDDEGAKLVAIVSNMNRVGHTTLERARSIKWMMDGGTTKFPIEAVAAMQGISVNTAWKLLTALDLPPDIQELMDPKVQRERGQEVLGKMPTYALGRLAGDPILHEHARDLANRYVNREIKLPELNAEVDRILVRAGAARDVVAERHQPARRLRFAERRISTAIDALRDAKGRLADLKEEGNLPEASKALVRDINDIADISVKILEIVGGKKLEKA